jgi:hypothetical protein
VCRTIAQTVSAQLPSAAARVPSQVRSCGIYGGQNDIRLSYMSERNLSVATCYTLVSASGDFPPKRQPTCGLHGAIF